MIAKKVGLVKKYYTTDSIGQKVPAENVRYVWGDIYSITSNEFSNAGMLGLKPDFRINVWQNEYDNEEEVVVDGVRHKIYRVYIDKSGKAELYVQKINT